MDEAVSDLSEDHFLGGRLRVLQPCAGYRAGVDPVLLAAAAPVASGARVLELGCGVGVASLCLGRRVENLKLTGVELQPDYAALARRNAQANALNLEVIQADLAALPSELRQRAFDHVIANPPYFLRDRSLGAEDPGRETALGEATPLAQWVYVAAKRLAPKGWLTLIQRTERLPELLAALEGRLGSVELCPLTARRGRAAKLIILRARKNGRAPMRLLAPVQLHEGAAHLRDAPDYTDTISAVLNEGAAFPWPE